MVEKLLVSEPQSLSERYASCIESYQQLLLSLGPDDCHLVQSGQVDYNRAKEEYGRIKIWGEQTKAFMPPNARGSLDDTLRHNIQLQVTAHGILSRLGWCLDQVTPTAARQSSNSDDDQLSLSSMSTDSDSDNEDSTDSEHPRLSKVGWLMQQAFEQIQALFLIASLLRRPGYAGKYIHSSRQANEKTNPLFMAFARFDQEHVYEKLRQWRGLSKSSAEQKWEDEDPISAADIHQRPVIDSSFDPAMMMICERLSNSNIRRREQLIYWADNPDNPAARASIRDLALGGRHEERYKKHKNDDTQSEVSTVRQKPLLDDGKKSSYSKQSFSTVATSAVFESWTASGRPRTVYAQSNAARARLNRVPNAPFPVDGSETFLCPYCGMTLATEAMKDRQAWKRHVFRDLRPYSCTFPTCTSPEKLYATRHDWIYHEMQIHRREFVCGDCGDKQPTRGSMEAHLRTYHSTATSNDQLDIILDMCDRPIDESQQSFCPLCSEEMTVHKLQHHLAEHMEELSLFVLPNTVDEEQIDGNSQLSKNVARTGAESNDGVSSLGSQNSFGTGRPASPSDFTSFGNATISDSTGSSQHNHWASYIFDGQHPVSPLNERGESTKCLGQDEPMAVRMLADDDFLRVLEIPFESSDVMVRLYWRPSDHRARILYLTEKEGIRHQYCIPLTAIRVLRSSSSLLLCRVNSDDGELDLWASLHFTCFETMVLFFSTFVAMKTQDWVATPQGLEDYFAPGEIQEYGGQIEDDRFLHVLRVFRDTDSGAVRLEAATQRGPRKGCPIWTAFVTRYIGSKTWIKRTSATTVQMEELRPYVFCNDYTPHVNLSGKFELQFTTSNGM